MIVHVNGDLIVIAVIIILRFDKASAIGRFTWATIAEDKFIPVLFRDKEEYVSIKMAEISVIGELLNVLPVELYESIKISAYYVSALL